MANGVSLLPSTDVFTKPQSLGELLAFAKVAQQQQQQQQQQASATAAPQTVAASGSLPPEITTGRSAGQSTNVAAPSPYDEAYAAKEQKYGLPEGTLKGMGYIESRHNPRAWNELSHSQYKGLMQLGRDEAASTGVTNVWDPNQSIDGAARLAVRNQNTFRSRMRRDPTASEIYLMHQQGAAGGLALIQHPDLPAWKALSSGAGLDPQTAWTHIRANNGDPNAPASQFIQKWDNFYTPLKRSQVSAYSDDAKTAFDQYRKKPPQQPAPQQVPAPIDTHPDVQSAHDTFAQYKRPTAPAADFSERFAPAAGQSSLDVRGDPNQKGTVAAAMQKKFDPYAGLGGLEHVWSEGKKKEGDLLQETIRWAKRNPELAGGMTAAGSVAAVMGGRAALPVIAAAPGVAGTIRVARKILSNPGVQYGLAEAGLGHVVDLLHGISKAGSSISHLLGE